jgi:RHS repeat-associated protein
VQTTYTYEPFGTSAVTGQTNTNSYQYTARENDGTGLDYYRARYYYPSHQRFISEDPIGFRAGDINFYAYAFQNPVNLRDPFGFWTFQLGGNIGGNVPIWGPVGIGGSLFGGAAYDGSHWAWYWGGGLGPGVGAGFSGGVTVGGSNAQSVCGLRGLFGNLGGSGGAGFGGGAAIFAGNDSQGNTVLGGDVMIGGAAGASGTLQATYTWVRPLGGRYTCPN